jgi:hypothetical protein
MEARTIEKAATAKAARQAERATERAAGKAQAAPPSCGGRAALDADIGGR